MDLENLKSNWQTAGSGQKNQDQLLKMTKIKNHPKIKRMRIKFLIEAVLLLVFLAVYYDGFDGATKPLWANLLLIGSTTAYIVSRFIGWIIIRNPISETNLKKSLLSFQRNLKRIAISIWLTAFLFGAAIIVFFSSSVVFTNTKYLILFFMVVSLIVLVYLSSRNWIKRMRSINGALKEFEKTN